MLSSDTPIMANHRTTRHGRNRPNLRGKKKTQWKIASMYFIEI
jgi:hypothetical protein